MLTESLPPWYGISLGCGKRKWLPNLEDYCKYTVQAVMNSQQGVVLHLEISQGLTTPHYKKTAR